MYHDYSVGAQPIAVSGQRGHTPSELPAVLMLSALLHRPFLGFSVAPFPFCAPARSRVAARLSGGIAIGHGMADPLPTMD